MNTQVTQLFDETLRPLKYGILFDDSGRQVYPDSVSVEITRGDNTALQLENAPMIDAATGETQLDWSAADSAAMTIDVPGFDNRARWSFINHTVADSSTVLELHFDNTQQPAVFEDTSTNATSVTRIGDTIQQAAIKKFPGMAAEFDGAGDYLTVPNTAPFDLSSGDFTIESWVYTRQIGANVAIYSHGDGFNDTAATLFMNTAGAINFQIYDAVPFNTLTLSTAPNVLALNTWHHVAVERTGTTYRIYIDGDVKVTTDSAVVPVATIGLPTIGAEPSGTSWFWNGFMDDFRFSSVARYQGTLNVPATAFDTDILERTQYFDVVFAEIRTRVKDPDLIEVYPPLMAARKKYSGKATGGTLSTVVDTGTLTPYPAEFFRSGIISFVTGANLGRNRPVIQFDAANSTLTVSPAFNFNVDAGDAYTIDSSYNAQISQAWRQIFGRVVKWFDRESAGRLLDGEDFTDPHLFLSLAMAAETLIQGKEDQYSIAAARFRQQYESELNGLKVKLDISAAGDGSSIAHKPLIRFWGK